MIKNPGPHSEETSKFLQTYLDKEGIEANTGNPSSTETGPLLATLHNYAKNTDRFLDLGEMFQNTEDKALLSRMLEEKDFSGNTPILTAAQSHSSVSAAICMSILKERPDVNVCYPNGATLTAMVATRKDSQVLEEVIRQGGELFVEKKNRKETISKIVENARNLNNMMIILNTFYIRGSELSAGLDMVGQIGGSLGLNHPPCNGEYLDEDEIIKLIRMLVSQGAKFPRIAKPGTSLRKILKSANHPIVAAMYHMPRCLSLQAEIVMHTPGGIKTISDAFQKYQIKGASLKKILKMDPTSQRIEVTKIMLALNTIKESKKNWN